MTNDSLPRWDPASEIDNGRRSFLTAIRTGNTAEACEVYADDARLLVPSADPIEGRVAIEAYWRAGIAAGMTEITLDELERGRREGFAFEIGRYEMRLQTAEADVVVDRGMYLFVHEKRGDGKWLRQIEVLTPDGRPHG